MKSALLFAFCIVSNLLSFAQSGLGSQVDPLEVRFIKAPKPYNLTQQQLLRSKEQWQSFMQTHGTWYVHFNEQTGLPHRAYGQPINMAGDSPEMMALQFAELHLAQFNLPLNELVPYTTQPKGKYQWANFYQEHQGHKVLGSKYTVKFAGSKVVMFGCDLYNDINIDLQPTLTLQQATDAASTDINQEITFASAQPITCILPIAVPGAYEYHLVYEVMVKTISETAIPSHYYTLVDAHTGQILYRQNKVAHHRSPACHHPHSQTAPAAPVTVVTANVTGTVYPFNPYNATQVQGLANAYITVNGTNYAVGPNGAGNIAVAPGSTGQLRMMGPWCRVYTEGVTPSMNVTLQDGNNNFSFDNNSSINERCAYKGANEIHDFMKYWMPDFEGMDFQLTTNVDEAGECNAFYDGSSINFFGSGGGCNATSLLADVIYHEYGHGINDYFYQSLDGIFINGAMGEGYADYWGVSLTNNPNLGIGFYTDNELPLREYDAEPKVYPVDITGEVHNDGEIIMGAWWDSHVLMGSDWNITMPLFVEAYAGLQAETFNGNEGEAYTDVLIDLLQADDDDNDITNGTPHGNAIVEGFYTHGITLISNAELSHDPILFVNSNEGLTLEAQLDLNFPYTQYLESVKAHYRINNGPWIEADMTGNTSDEYSLDIPVQPAGTVVAYYFSTSDVNGSMGISLPAGAHQNPFPNLPYFTLCGVEAIKVHDCDDNNDFGVWQTGLPSDNATTGEWEQDDPIGSYTTTVAPGTEVAVEDQHTPGGEICFFTGNASSVNAGIGENDVDGGKTTLQSPIIDMSGYDNPIIAYWRYYTNSPPGGANPGQDYWQVRMTNNNGATWTYIENNRTSDMSWRRNAFRVADFLEPTSQMRFQFIASDSIWVGQYLDGGSLVEAAVDDFVLYDSYVVSVDENQAPPSLSVYPSPADNEITISCRSCSNIQNIRITAANGQQVAQEQINMRPLSVNSMRIDISALAAGVYTATIGNQANGASATFVKK